MVLQIKTNFQTVTNKKFYVSLKKKSSMFKFATVLIGKDLEINYIH